MTGRIDKGEYGRLLLETLKEFGACSWPTLKHFVGENIGDPYSSYLIDTQHAVIQDFLNRGVIEHMGRADVYQLTPKAKNLSIDKLVDLAFDSRRI